MALNFYKGYIPTTGESGKTAAMPFKDKTSDELLTLEEAQKFNSYAGILADDTVLVDIDTEKETDILLNVVKSLGLKCRVLKSRSGGHFLFKIDKPMSNRTKVSLGIGITADIKGCGRASYEVLKINGQEREVLYDIGVGEHYQFLPKYLFPIKTSMKLLDLAEGEGRNNALFSYILPLQQNEFTIDECRECIRIINEFVLAEPLSEEELSVILRDGAFNKPTFFTSKGSFLFDKFARYLKQAENIIKINGKLYIYRDGIYECGDEYIESAMIEHIPNLSRSKRQEVLSYLSLLVSRENGVADANLIAFKNGVLNVADNTFNEFSPEYVITNKIPHNYNPDAKSELLEKVMRKLACGDETVETLLYQSIGYCFYRRNELRKSFFLLGEKRNGKSTFLDLVGTLLGEDNTANLDLCEIGHQFKTAELNGKLANIGDDINDEWVSNTATFKKVVSGDVITAERKGKDPFKLRSFAKFFFSANSLPRLGRGKDSSAVLDRLVVIPFDAKFSKDDPDYDPFIKYKLRNEDVMEALIAKSIPALRTVLTDQEFAHCSKVDKNLEEFEKSNNPILEFFEELDERDYLNEPIKAVYQRYSAFCLGNNFQAMSAIEFQKQMKKQFNLIIKTIENDGRKVRVYQYE
jgi:putative DNA primase/helicase